MCLVYQEKSHVQPFLFTNCFVCALEINTETTRYLLSNFILKRQKEKSPGLLQKSITRITQTILDLEGLWLGSVQCRPKYGILFSQSHFTDLSCFGR